MRAHGFGQRTAAAVVLVALGASPLPGAAADRPGTGAGETRGPRDARARADSLESVRADEEILVSAAKLPVLRSDVAASVTVLDGARLRASAAQTLPEALSAGAGLHAYDFAGNGMLATAESRGFAAFGETSYLRFQVDGIPFGDLAEDDAIWNLLDLDQLDRVELIRSASSSLHGNTAFTGVVNLVPFAARAPWAFRARVGGGSHGRRDGTVTGGWRNARSRGTGSVHARTIDGWRDHSSWTGYSTFATLGSISGGPTRARLGIFHHDSDAELPGPLPEPLLDTRPETASTPLDREELSELHVVGLFESAPHRATPFTTSLYLQREDRTLVESIVDTQREDRESFTYGAQGSVRLGARAGGLPLRLLAGGEGSVGEMTSSFRPVDEGGGVGSPLTDATVHRDALAAHVRLEVDPVPRVSVALAVRRDDIWAELTPDEADSSGARAHEKIMNAWSPAASINVKLGRSGNAYAQLGRSFRTPTLTQLYELRPFPVGPGATITISSPSLDPQRAWQAELGVRGNMGARVAFDLAVYTMKAEDEIGFDLATFSFANIGESTHRGIEASVSASPIAGIELNAGHTLTVAEFDGEFAGADVDGNQINNVPKYLTRAGVSYTHRFLTVGAALTDVRDQWADEANTVEVPDYTLLDVNGALRIAGQEVYLRVQNVTDETYAPAGFVGFDPATGGPISLFYPSPGRRFEAGLRVALE